MTKPMPHNQQLLDFIKRNQPISFVELFRNFDGAGNESEAFIKRLAYLKSQGCLVNTGRGVDAMWRVNPDADVGTASSAKQHEKPAPSAAPAVPPPVEKRAPPARYNVLDNTWRPAPGPALRPGCDEHTNAPSLRNGRRVPYVPGQIIY